MGYQYGSAIYEPEHGYLENTLPSIAAAFSAGADLVEFDLQLTKDGKFAVFHDHRLDYRTNGQGGVGDYTMAELKKLDIGYGYTADGAEPSLCGDGVGLMPSLDEVLTAFPGRSFLIHLKSNQPQLGPLLVEYLRTLPPEQLNLLTFTVAMNHWMRSNGHFPLASDVEANNYPSGPFLFNGRLDGLCSSGDAKHPFTPPLPLRPLAMGMAPSVSTTDGKGKYPHYLGFG